MRSFRWFAALAVAVSLTGFCGCGTSLNEGLYQAASASGRSLLDIFLTDLQNSVADSLDATGTPPGGDQIGGDTTPPPDAAPVDDTPIEDLTGDPTTGEGIFVSNNCTACHCVDAVGGCALNAPSLVGVSSGELDDRLRGDVAHPGGKFNFSNQDIVDLQAYLDSLAG